MGSFRQFAFGARLTAKWLRFVKKCDDRKSAVGLVKWVLSGISVKWRRAPLTFQ
jgi:hypothetical protein